MARKSKWEKKADAAVASLREAQLAFSRAGLYLTSLLLQEAIRVGEYERFTELERYKRTKK